MRKFIFFAVIAVFFLQNIDQMDRKTENYFYSFLLLKLCRAWGKGGVLEGSYFNYWAWFTPDSVAWAKGERWLRCDAMKTLNDQEPYVFGSWKGQKLKNKKKI